MTSQPASPPSDNPDPPELLSYARAEVGERRMSWARCVVWILIGTVAGGLGFVVDYHLHQAISDARKSKYVDFVWLARDFFQGITRAAVYLVSGWNLWNRDPSGLVILVGLPAAVVGVVVILIVRRHAPEAGVLRWFFWVIISFMFGTECGLASMVGLDLWQSPGGWIVFVFVEPASAYLTLVALLVAHARHHGDRRGFWLTDYLWWVVLGPRRRGHGI
jgi:hypothetical protein